MYHRAFGLGMTDLQWGWSVLADVPFHGFMRKGPSFIPKMEGCNRTASTF